MIDKPSSRILERAEILCAERGVRLTEQRKIALLLMCQANKPITAYELLEMMRGKVKSPTPTTVYRALDFLLEQGFVHKLETLHAYVKCTHLDHPHISQFMICSDCGDVTEFEDSGLMRRLNAAGKANGFQTKRPVVELLGTCAQCGDAYTRTERPSARDKR